MRHQTSCGTESRTDAGALVRRCADGALGKGLLARGDQLLVAVSGGPDSVALLSVLTELAGPRDLKLRVLHINHGLRGAEAEEDAEFVATLCERLGVPLSVERVCVLDSVGSRGSRSLQEAAREARYAALRRTAELAGAKLIALGHQADDQAETVLMWMLRGCGARGLSGMPMLREGVYIRPLLHVRRAQILAYLDARGLPYRADSSNASLRYVRNRIRQEVLPVLERLNPAIVRVLCRQARILAEEDRWVGEEAQARAGRFVTESREGEVVLDGPGFRTLPLALQRRIIRSVLWRVGGTEKGPSWSAVSAVLDSVVQGRSGAVLTLRGARAFRENDTVYVQSLSLAKELRATDGESGVPPSGILLRVPSSTRWPPTGDEIRVRARAARDGDRAGLQRDRPIRAILDADRVGGELRARSWQRGDWFQPSGMGGHRKKLQDFFSDRKVPRRSRHRIPVLVGREGIVWVAGYRPDERVLVTDSTKRVLVIELVSHPS